MHPFLSNEARATFFYMLSSTKSAIYGHVPFALVSTGMEINEELVHDINIAVPRNTLLVWTSYLRSIGYYSQEMVPTPYCHSRAGDATVRCRRRNRRLSITITQSFTDSVLPIILSSDVTTYMNVITSSHIFAFYPQLTANSTAIGSFEDMAPYRGFTYYRLSMIHAPSTEHWDKPCGEACPGMWRRTRGLPGVGVLKWDCFNVIPPRRRAIAPARRKQSATSGVEDGAWGDRVPVGRRPSFDAYHEFATSMFKWRIGAQCLNESPFPFLNRISNVLMLDYLPETTEDIILSSLDPVDLLRYAKISGTTYALTHSYIRRAFNIIKLLSPFFSELEIAEFRRLQADTGMIISGDLALDFFERNPFSGAPLEVYVEHQFSLNVGRWFMSAGYDFVVRDRRNGDFKFACTAAGGQWNGQDGVHQSPIPVLLFTFYHEAKKRYIFVRTVGGSAMEAILHFDSTSMMNIISHDKAVSFYPRATFDVLETLHIHYYGGNSLNCSKREGWTVKTIPMLNLREIRTNFRSVGDRLCWTIPLGGETLAADYRVEANSWRHNFSMYNRMRYTLVLNYRMKFNYVQGHNTARESGEAAMKRHYDGKICADEYYVDVVVEVYRAL
ncbi:hypothetical protein Hypma_002444 [Hypsizygus marmoreus]|uniref:F-box domain-containing protein n=1 Tax=Hypsizygus marmoreus TaxID=39966 RepID=A0A369J651_HYPMA|nr:hypothetical protein Hypma_002444 [Hypsizygus marmoreus]